VPVLPLTIGEHDEQDHLRGDVLAMRHLRPDLESGTSRRAAPEAQSLVIVTAGLVYRVAA